MPTSQTTTCLKSSLSKLIFSTAALLLLVSSCSSDDSSSQTPSTPLGSVQQEIVSPDVSTTAGVATTNAIPATTAAPTVTLAQPTGETEGSGSASDPGAEDEPLTLGYLLATTGGLAYFAAPLIGAIHFAVSQAEEAGFQEVGLLGADTASDSDTAKGAFDGLLMQGTDAVIGTSSSFLTMSVIDKAVESETVLISASATSPTFTEYEDDGFFFRTVAPDTFRGIVLGDLVSEKSPEGVVIVYRADTFGSSLAEATAARLESNGTEVVGQMGLDPNADDYSSEVSELMGISAEAVVLIVFNEDGGSFLNQYMQASEEALSALEDAAGAGDAGDTDGAEDAGDTEEASDTLPQQRDFYMQDSFSPGAAPWEPVSTEGLGELPGIRSVQGLTLQALDESSELFQAYINFVSSDAFVCPEAMSDEICDLVGTPGSYIWEAYDAAVVLMLASLQASSTEPSAIANEINAVSIGGRKCYSYLECAELVLDDVDIDYEGASGSLDFTDVGEPSTGLYEVWELNLLGQLQLVAQISAQ